MRAVNTLRMPCIDKAGSFEPGPFVAHMEGYPSNHSPKCLLLAIRAISKF
jgi:hypothetical protein